MTVTNTNNDGALSSLLRAIDASLRPIGLPIASLALPQHVRQLRFMAQLLHQLPSSYLCHLRAFYISVFLSITRRLPSAFTDPQSPLRHAIHRAFHTSASLVVRLMTALNHLLAPKLIASLLWRHSLALLCLFLSHIFYQLCVSPIVTRLKSSLRRFYRSHTYLAKEKYLLIKMTSANDYDSWNRAAKSLDKLQGLQRWKLDARSRYYDWHRIREDLQSFRQLVDDRDIAGIMAHSRARLYRNLVGINDRRLYSVLRAGTKRLIEEYICEVVRALQLVCVIDSEDVTAADKLAFFNETRHAFGRTALLLSGGSTLGLYHTGVVKALHDNNLLPRVLSGASVGAIVVAMLGTRTDEEIHTLFDDDHQLTLEFFPTQSEASWSQRFKRLFSAGEIMDIDVLEACVKANVPNLTFTEAYERSGRIINIVVSPAVSAGNQDSSRLLNYLTAPNVLVWSAVLASCAIPGLFHAVEIQCKDEAGNQSAWIEGRVGVKWEDGSVRADLPMERLRELFNINHFIVSQVNPHVIPFLSSHVLASPSSSSLSLLLPRLIEFLTTSLKSMVLNLVSNGLFPFHSPLRFVLDQTYVGDITLVPPVNAKDYSLLLANPTAERLHECLTASERATFSKLAMIRGACEIEMALDDGVRRMRGQLILDEMVQAQHIQRLSRVRSWSTDFDTKRKRVHGSDNGSALNEKENGDQITDNGESTGVANGVSLMVRRRSEPVESRPAVNVNGHNQLAETSPLHLPSTNYATAKRIAPLNERNAVAALSHRSVGESVAHAYVLANKSVKREKSSMTAQNSPQTSMRTITERNAQHSLLSHVHRSHTPPPVASAPALLQPNLTLMRQSSALQQLMHASGSGSISALSRSWGSGSASESKDASEGHESLPTSGNSINASSSLTLPLLIPPMVSFRPVEPRHMSAMDLARLAHAPDDEADDREEAEWNALMTHSDDGEDDEAESQGYESGSSSGSVGLLASFLPFAARYQRSSSVMPTGTRSSSSQPAAPSSLRPTQSASHHHLKSAASTSPMASGVAGLRSASSSRLVRNLSLNELAGDLTAFV